MFNEHTDESFEEEREFANEGPLLGDVEVAAVRPPSAGFMRRPLVKSRLLVVGCALDVVTVTGCGVAVAVEVLPDNLERGKAIRLEVAARVLAVRSVLISGGLKTVFGGSLLLVVVVVVALAAEAVVDR